jgi:hypothetical protein
VKQVYRENNYREGSTEELSITGRHARQSGRVGIINISEKEFWK